MPKHALLRQHRLVVERRIEERIREIGAERTADLHGANGTPRARAAAKIFDQFADGDAKGELNQPAA